MQVAKTSSVSDRRIDMNYLLVIGAPRSGTTLLATMIGRHTEVGMLNEDTRGKAFRRVLGKSITGNKLCVPNQIQMKRKSVFALRLFKKLGLMAESPRSEYAIEDYLQLPNLKIIAILRDPFLTNSPSLSPRKISASVRTSIPCSSRRERSK